MRRLNSYSESTGGKFRGNPRAQFGDVLVGRETAKRDIMRHMADDTGFDGIIIGDRDPAGNFRLPIIHSGYKTAVSLPNTGTLIDPQTGQPFGKADVRIAGRLHRGVHDSFLDESGSPKLYYHRTKAEFNPADFKRGWFSGNPHDSDIAYFGPIKMKAHFVSKKPYIPFVSDIPYSAARQISRRIANVPARLSIRDKAHNILASAMPHAGRGDWEDVIKIGTNLGFDSVRPFGSADWAVPNPVFSGKILINPHTGRPFSKR